MKANGSITGSAGYLGKPVTEMVINEDGTASFWYMKDAAVNPVIAAAATDINFEGVMAGSSATRSFKVMAAALTGDVMLTVNDPAGVFTVDPAVISASDAIEGTMVNVTFTPRAVTDYNATVTLSSAGAQDIVVHLAGHGLIEGHTPVMLPADDAYINLTQFRADWTDQTPAENVSSYTLEVRTKPEVALLGSLNGSDYTGSYAYINLSAPWGGNSVLGGNNAIYFNRDGKIYFTVPEGYSNETFTLKLMTVSHNYGQGRFTVATPQTAGVEHYFNSGETFAWLVTASTGESITITTTDNPYSADIALIEVYSGDATVATLRATETGDDTYRLITGINDRSYTVKDLLAGGTYLYKVKSIFSDGTESDWSNVCQVTLFENGHGYALGDVNHDGSVDIADVTYLINILLTKSTDFCYTCADVNGDSAIDIADVTALINLLLSKGASS
jgi:hypothetical protein